jgi:predicted metal-dependent hydrolase
MDCGQDVVCATPPGCMRHWGERNRELLARHEQALEDVERLQDMVRELRGALLMSDNASSDRWDDLLRRSAKLLRGAQ